MPRALPSAGRPEDVLDRVDADSAAAVIAAALTRGGGWLRPGEVDALLGAYGVPLAGGDPSGSSRKRDVAGCVEMVAGVLGDPDFGPVVVCGPGGPAAELLGDAAVRLSPLSRPDAADLLRSLRSFPLLLGYRGAPRTDVGALEDLLVRLSVLADAHPEVTEVDCDPVLVSSAGAVVVDARIHIRPTAPRRPFPALDR